MCHNVHHPKTHAVVLFTSCRVFSHSAMTMDDTSNSTPPTPFAGLFSHLNLSLAPILARGQHRPTFTLASMRRRRSPSLSLSLSLSLSSSLSPLPLSPPQPQPPPLLSPLNSLTAIGAHERQGFNKLRGTVVSRRVFIRSQSLIAR